MTAPQPLRFEAARTAGGVHVHHFLPGDDTPVHHQWPGLYEQWPDGPTPFSEYAVNNGNTEEVAVYTGLVWRLTSGLTRYATPTYYRDDAAHLLRQEPVMVDWEYETDAEGLTSAARDRGFVPGRSVVRFHPPATAREREHAGCAGLFALTTPRDLVAALRAVAFDASGEVTVFAVAPGAARFERLVASLRGPDRPTLDRVLEADEVFADLTIGSDIGYHDSLMFASHRDPGPRLGDLARDYARRIASYERRVAGRRPGEPGIPDVPAFLREMAALAGISLDAP